MDSHLSRFVGKVVLFKITDQFLEQAHSLVQPHDKVQVIYGKLIAADDVGCWVENPCWTTTDAKTNQESVHMAHILIPWHAVVSAVVFPNRAFDGAPDEAMARSIGFHAEI